MEREQILERLKSFYTRNDPQKKFKTFEPMVNYAMAEGLDKLNALLLRKYGDKIELDSFPVLDRDEVRHQVELFYLKHDPKKIDKPEDIEAIVEFITIHGKNKLDEKLVTKYQERLKDATLDDAIDMIRAYYTRLKLVKTDRDCRILAEWGLKNSYCALNTRLIKKYGKGLGELDSKKQREDLRLKIEQFYEVHDDSQLDDERNLQRITDWTLKYGVHRLNEKLQAKYQANLNTIQAREPVPIAAPQAVPPPAATPQRAAPAPTTRLEPPARISSPTPVPPPMAPALSKRTMADELASTHSSEINKEAEQIVESDEKRLEELSSFTNLFLAKHDTERLYDGGASDILAQLKAHGEKKVEDQLCSQYGEGLKSIEQQYVDLERKLEMFYKIHDPERLQSPMDGVIGWAIVHGEDKLNGKLMAKYDEDLEAAGLKQRLQLFYRKVGEERSEAEISKIASYAIARGLGKLNKRLKKKYGHSLEDQFALDEQIADGGSYMSDRLTQASALTASTAMKQRSNRTATQAIQTYKETAEATTKMEVVEVTSPKRANIPRNTQDPRDDLSDAPITRRVRDRTIKKGAFKNGLPKVNETLDVDIDVDANMGNKDDDTDLDEFPENAAYSSNPLDDFRQVREKPPKETNINHQKTRQVVDVETENQIKERFESSFTAAELDMRQGNRKSLKQARRRRGSSTSLAALNKKPMNNKLQRFLAHVEDYRASQRMTTTTIPQPQKVSKENAVSKSASGSFSYKNDMADTESRASSRAPMASVLYREKKAANNLVGSLMKFYRRHDKRKANGKVIRRDVEFTLKHGKEALNEKLMRQYGESLNSLENKQNRNLDKKKLVAMRSTKNFTQVANDRMKELDGILDGLSL